MFGRNISYENSLLFVFDTTSPTGRNGWGPWSAQLAIYRYIIVMEQSPIGIWNIFYCVLLHQVHNQVE